MTSRMKLRRSDGRVYLERWGVEHARLGGVFVHRMTAADPGLDLHDHPWWFVSLILWGGYVEERLPSELAVARAQFADRLDSVRFKGLHPRPWHSARVALYRPVRCQVLGKASRRLTANATRLTANATNAKASRGNRIGRNWLSWRSFPRTHSHRIIALNRASSWSLVIHGPRRQSWGFHTPDGWIEWTDYEATGRRHLQDDA